MVGSELGGADGGGGGGVLDSGTFTRLRDGMENLAGYLPNRSVLPYDIEASGGKLTLTHGAAERIYAKILSIDSK
jgi:hypothetical protein